MSVHCGILKIAGEKSYHPYLSDDLTYDQKFVKVCIEEMLSTINIPLDMCIESDNCSSQYKSSEHFHDLQSIANSTKKMLIRVFGIAGHGKGEVDHVGGIAKISIRREIANGACIEDADDMVTFLSSKFGEKTDPNYVVNEVDPKQLDILRADAKSKRFATIKGSSNVQIMVFTPGASFYVLLHASAPVNNVPLTMGHVICSLNIH